MKRPVRVMLQALRVDPLVLPANTPISEATHLALNRPRELIYEPLIVLYPELSYRLLDIQVLLVAHSQIFMRLQQELQSANDQLATRFDQLQLQALRLAEAKEDAEKASNALQKRTSQLQAARQVSKRITFILDINQLLIEIVAALHKQFDYYFVGIWLVDDMAQFTLKAGLSRANDAVIQEYKIDADSLRGAMATAYKSKKYSLTNEATTLEINLPTDLLPEARSELAIPLLVNRKGYKQTIGVLDIQGDIRHAIDKDDRRLMQLIANEIAIAIENAKSYTLTQQANRDLERLNADKDKFYSIVAHDLRGPFMPLLGNLEFLASFGDTLPPNEVKEISQSLHRSAKNVFDLLENLLNWSRMQMGRMDYTPQTLGLADIVQKSIELLSGKAIVKEIALLSRVPIETQIHADANMVDTVIRNLINNALKFTPKGGRITVEAQTLDQWVQVSISDTGIGIAPERLEKLFVSGSSKQSTLGTAKETGTGLGLVMCQEMIHLNGGKIWAKSVLGEGSQMHFTLPLGE